MAILNKDEYNASFLTIEGNIYAPSFTPVYGFEGEMFYEIIKTAQEVYEESLVIPSAPTDSIEERVTSIENTINNHISSTGNTTPSGGWRYLNKLSASSGATTVVTQDEKGNPLDCGEILVFFHLASSGYSTDLKINGDSGTGIRASTDSSSMSFGTAAHYTYFDIPDSPTEYFIAFNSFGNSPSYVSATKAGFRRLKKTEGKSKIYQVSLTAGGQYGTATAYIYGKG